MSEGCVYLVGAGPGDPGLLTVRGRQLLSMADVVVYDHLVSEQLLEHAPAHAERIYAGKRASAHTLSQQEINRLLVERARGGATVVRLKGGDPFVFGRGGEEALALADAGIAFEVVPGVTAGVAGPAYAGIPLTHRDVASSVTLVTGHEASGKRGSALDWQALAATRGTLVFYMGMGNLRSICERLVREGLAPDTPAAVTRWATTPRQQVVAGTVGTVPDMAEEAALEPPALIVIGRVVGLREKLAWFERRPLLGRRIVVTRARRQAGGMASRLAELGAQVIELPVIRIEPPRDSAPLRKAVCELREFDWVVFTSVNGVDAFFAALSEEGRDSRALAPVRVCVIGPATAGRLAEFGIRPDARPDRFTSAGVVQALASLGELRAKRILCPRSDIAPPELTEGLTARGAVVRQVVAYRTVPETAGADRAVELLGGDEVDWLTFTSSSTVENFFAMIQPELARSSSARIASIGPVTSEAIRRFGLVPEAEAEPHTTDGLIEAVVRREESMEVTS